MFLPLSFIISRFTLYIKANNKKNLTAEVYFDILCFSKMEQHMRVQHPS